MDEIGNFVLEVDRVVFKAEGAVLHEIFDRHHASSLVDNA